MGVKGDVVRVYRASPVDWLIVREADPQGSKTERVVSVTLRDVRFVVDEADRRREVKLHAWAEGTVDADWIGDPPPTEIVYHAAEGVTFTRRLDGTSIDRARFAKFTNVGKVFVEE